MENELIELMQLNPLWAYALVFAVLLACGLGVPVPEDITLLGAGYSVYLGGLNGQGQPELIPMVVVGLVGVLSGDVILFSVGRWAGPSALRIWPFRRLISEHRLARVNAFFSRYGSGTAFLARFAAGIRAPIYLLAGASQMRFRVFFFADGAAALVSVPLLIWLAWRFGAQIDRVKEWLGNSRYALVLVALVIGVVVVFRHMRSKRAESGRRHRKLD